MNFDLTAACGNCPFRNDAKAIELREGRVEGIQDDLLGNDWQSFTCHKTLTGEHEEDEEGNDHYVSGENEQACGGSMVWLLKRQAPSVMMRVTAMRDDTFYPRLEANFGKVIE